MADPTKNFWERLWKLIKNGYFSIIDFIKWEYYEGLSWSFYKCMFCDLDNILSSLPFFFLNLIIIFTGFSLIVYSFFIISQFSTLAIIAILSFFIGISLIPIIILSFIIDLPLGLYQIYNSYQQSTKYPENLSGNPHTGVFFPHYASLKREFFISDSIALLIENLRKYNQPYKIYNCYTSDDFKSAYQDLKVNRIWIIGHGKKNGVCIGSTLFEYSNLPNALPKEFIAQLHCNHGEGPSLLDINNPVEGFCSNLDRMTFQNHCYIINYFRQFEQK